MPSWKQSQGNMSISSLGTLPTKPVLLWKSFYNVSWGKWPTHVHVPIWGHEMYEMAEMVWWPAKEYLQAKKKQENKKSREKKTPTMNIVPNKYTLQEQRCEDKVRGNSSRHISPALSAQGNPILETKEWTPPCADVELNNRVRIERRREPKMQASAVQRTTTAQKMNPRNRNGHHYQKI